MTVEYRPIRPEETEEFLYSGRIGFGASTDAAAIERGLAQAPVWTRPEWTLCAFDDGVLAAKMLTRPFRMRWNGREIGCGGVASVTTLPTHRRRGYLRELMTRAFVTMREAGQPVAMLWASMAAIYQRFGYGVGYTRWSASFDPRQLRFVEEIAPPGSVRLVKAAEAYPLLADAYHAFAAPRTLMLEREPEWWTQRVLRGAFPQAPRPLVAVYEEDGRVLGYVLYDVVLHPEWRPGPDQELRVFDLGWLSPAAHRALVQYLAAYDLARTVSLTILPVDDPLFYQAQEPRSLQIHVEDGTLVRIVDLGAALEGRGYDTEGRLCFSLGDDLCPWNSGVWNLSVEEGVARLQPSGAEPELVLTPRALAILASGHLGATTLARQGLIPPAAAAVLSTADALFRTAHAPLCTNDF